MESSTMQLDTSTEMCRPDPHGCKMHVKDIIFMNIYML